MVVVYVWQTLFFTQDLMRICGVGFFVSSISVRNNIYVALYGHASTLKTHCIDLNVEPTYSSDARTNLLSELQEVNK